MINKLKNFVVGVSPSSELEQIIAQGVATELEVRRLHSQGAMLSAKALIAAYQAEPGADPQEADKVEAALLNHEASLLAPSFRRLASAIRNCSRTSPIKKFGGYLDEGGDAALARIGATRPSFALACIRHVAEKWPDIFGNQTSVDALPAAISKALAARAAAYRAIESSWQRSDVSYVEADRLAGTVRVTFNCTSGEVPLSNNLGEALVAWAVERELTAKAA